MKSSPKPSQIAIVAGAGVMLIFSFLDFVKTSYGSVGYSAWSGDYLFPLAIFPLLFALVVGGTTAATLFGGVELPEPILTMNWKQIDFALAFAATAILLGLAISTPNGLDLGIGLIFSLLGTIALTAGTVMELLNIEVGGASGSGTQTPSDQPPTPF